LRRVPARYVDTDLACVVVVSRAPGWPATKSYQVTGRPVAFVSPDFCEDGRLLIRADEAGAFGDF
jgi:hypothetical protein